MAMTALEAIPADESVRELEARWGISRNALKARAKALGVELIRIISKQTVWPGAFLGLGDQLHHHLQSSRPMAEFGRIAPLLNDSTTKRKSAEVAQMLSHTTEIAVGTTGLVD